MSTTATERENRAYVSKAEVRSCLCSTLLLIICPVKVLARVTCKEREQGNPMRHHITLRDGGKNDCVN